MIDFVKNWYTYSFKNMVNLCLSLSDLYAPLPTPQKHRFNGFFFIREKKEMTMADKGISNTKNYVGKQRKQETK